MSAELPFLEQPFLRLLKFVATAFTGLERLITVFYNIELNKLQGYTLSVSEDHFQMELLEIGEFYSYFFARRREMKAFDWLVSEDLPFETSKSKYVPMIFDELNRNILLLRLGGAKDSNRDLLYLFFDPRKTIKGINLGMQELDTSRKELLAEIAYGVCITALQSFRTDTIHFQKFVSNTRYLAQKLQKERNYLESLQKSIGQSLLNLSLDIIKEFAAKKGANIKLSPEAEHVIRSYSGDIGELRRALTDACFFAFTLNDNKNHDIIIYDWHIHFEGQTRESPGILVETKQEEKLRRTWDFLNRLEVATQMVLDKNLPVTGKNLGMHCEKPISAPAISDALKKHHQRIKNLMDQHPDRWPLLRENFSPVQQILKPKQSPDQHKAAG